MFGVEAWSKLFCQCAADALQFEGEAWLPSSLPFFLASPVVGQCFTVGATGSQDPRFLGR